MLLLLLFSAITQAQTITITGIIKDSKDEPLSAVSVKIKNTNTGTTTDNSGTYSITVPSNKSILVFSRVDFIPQEIPIGKLKNINIVLKELINTLDDVVVIGYGTAKRKDITGSVASANMQDVEKAPVISFDQALAGRIAGVQVSGNDGQPGTTNNITIRGFGSITQDNSPLYVVDGFPQENADNNSISPADIESIEVLKDGSATAIYGARGANGVIIITTKRGKRGAPVVTYNSYYGYLNNTKRVALMDPYEFVKYQLELNAPAATAIYLVNGKSLDSYKDQKGLNLQDYIFRKAPMQNHDISVRGGNDATQYSISGNIVDQKGIVIYSGFKRVQGRFSLDQKVNTKLKVGANINYSSFSDYGSIVAASNFSATLSLLSNVWGYRPVTNNSTDLLDELFDPAIDPVVSGDYRFNPIISIKNELRESINANLTTNAYAQYNILPNLTLKVSGGYNKGNIDRNAFFNSQTNGGSPRNANGVNGSINNFQFSSWLNENTLTYKKKIRKHDFNVLGGFTAQQYKIKSYGFRAVLVPNESLGINGLDEAPLGNTYSTSNSSIWTMSSFLGRLNYNYASKYLFTTSFRADGSSKFLGKNKWSYFPSGAFAWRMSQENFFKRLKFIDDAKLRLSLALTGNNRVSDFPGYDQLNFGIGTGYSFNNSITQGLGYEAFGNPNLKWETTQQIDLGYDISLFKQRVQLTVDVYKKTTKDLLLRADIPATTGLETAFKNVGSIQNKGIEFTLNTVNFKKKSFKWESNFNISFNKNKVLALTENQNNILSFVGFDIGYNGNPFYISQIGQSLGQMYGLIWDGNYQYEDFDKTSTGAYILKSNVPDNGKPRANVQPGGIKYKDINGDGTINNKDFTIIGRGTPIHTGGFSNNFAYKNFDVNIFFQWSYGNDLLNANRLIFEGNGRPNLNQFATYTERWTPTNPSNTLYAAGGQGNAYVSSRVIEDGSYLRLKTISVGYNMPQKIIKKLKLKSLRGYVTTQNIYTWTKYSGPDPDVSVRNSPLTPGFDYSAYPNAKTLIVGFNLSL
jgi:TonB-dependent starch-binding outer membrane protein SusC